MERRFVKSAGAEIKDTRLVRVKRMNHIVEVMDLMKSSKGLQSIKKLSKAEYVNLATGEVIEYKQSVNRAQSIGGLKDTFRKIRDLINNNFTGAGNELHITLTYKENMTDTKQLHLDFKRFWQKYKRKYGLESDYLSIIEPQGRGAWHCHLLVKHLDKEKLFIPANELAKLWGHGFIKIKALEGVDNIGAYLSAYLGDIELTPETTDIAMEMKSQNNLEFKEVVTTEGQTKSYIKGGRLHMYPSGMNLYRHSKGIVVPEVEMMPYKDIKKIVGSTTPNYSRTVTIYADDETILNQITYVQFNTLRK